MLFFKFNSSLQHLQNGVLLEIVRCSPGNPATLCCGCIFDVVADNKTLLVDLLHFTPYGGRFTETFLFLARSDCLGAFNLSSSDTTGLPLLQALLQSLDSRSIDELATSAVLHKDEVAMPTNVMMYRLFKVRPGDTPTLSMPLKSAYYASIMLYAIWYLLCYILCWHNLHRPNWHKNFFHLSQTDNKKIVYSIIPITTFIIY